MDTRIFLNCVPSTIAQPIATEYKYCGDTPCAQRAIGGRKAQERENIQIRPICQHQSKGNSNPPPLKTLTGMKKIYHENHNYYSQLSYSRELISITVTVTVIIFPGINYKTVINSITVMILLCSVGPHQRSFGDRKNYSLGISRN